MFNRTRHDVSTRIHGTISNVNQAWASHPNNQILPMLANAEPGSESAMTRFLMMVPPCYAPIIINRRLSPKQIWAELDGAIIANDDQEKCAPLLTWMVLSATRPAATSTSTLVMPRPAPPLGDAPLLHHRRELIYQLLPNLDPTRVIGDPSAARVADYLGETLDEIHLSRQDTMDRAAAAKAPKIASQYFTPEGCAWLMTICGVMNEGELPKIWRLLPQYGKKDRLAVELALKQTSQ
jgi:hypothetical protein